MSDRQRVPQRRRFLRGIGGIALGLPFGASVWLGAHVIMVPALGLAAPPTRQPPAKEALEFVLHLVYGAVTEVVRRLVRRAL